MRLQEIIDLAAAWLILSAAFANLLGGLTVSAITVALITVGIGFLLHELAHRVVARSFGLGAEFRANYSMLALAFLLSFAGFIFAAPGAVYTQGSRSGREQMLISVAGPVTNIFLAAAFFFVPGVIGSYGFTINAWLALFNMIPFGGLDGEAVFQQNKIVFFIVTAIAAAMVFVPLESVPELLM